MTGHAYEEYRIFAVNSNRPLLLGECYLIATAYNTFGPYWFGEQFLLLELPTKRLDRAKFRVKPPANVVADLSMVNADFVFDGVKGLAKSALDSILIKQFEATKNGEIFAAKFEFNQVKDDALTSCWVRNLFHNEFREAADDTEVKMLQKVLDDFRRLPVFERTRTS